MDVSEKAKLVMETEVCDNCLGRQFAKIGKGTNKQRGRLVRAATDRPLASLPKSGLRVSSGLSEKGLAGLMKADSGRLGIKVKEVGCRSACSVCNGLFQRLGGFAEMAGKAVEGYEFRTFVVGCKPTAELVGKEEALWERVGVEWCEPLKSEFNREVGKLIADKLGKEADLEGPELRLTFDLAKDSVDLQVKPLYVYGEYQKLARGIPQTKWDMYKVTVEDLIAKPFMRAAKAGGHSLHGCIGGSSKILLDKCNTTIEDLRDNWASNKAISFNEKAGVLCESNLADFMEIDTKGMRIYKIRSRETGRELVLTKEHPVYTQKGMTPLAKVRVGDKVCINPFYGVELRVADTILLDDNAMLNVVKNRIPHTNVGKAFQDLRVRGLLPLKLDNKNMAIITRLLAFLFGDGHVKLLKRRDVGLEFYGKRGDLELIKEELKILGFSASIHSCKTKESFVTDLKGARHRIKATESFKVTCYSKSLWILMVALGAPIGDKSGSSFNLPGWVLSAPLSIKAEFLAAFFGAEMSTPRLDKREFNRKSFNCPIFSLNKAESHLKNGVSFMESIKAVLSELGIETYKIRIIPYHIRKGGEKSYKIRLDFSNRYQNLINLYGKVGFRYCSYRAIESRYALEYLLSKYFIVKKRRELFLKAQSMKGSGLTLSQIHKALDSELVDKKDVWLWLNGDIKERNIKVPNWFPDYEEWKKDNTLGATGLVWETIDSIEPVEEEYVYDLTVEGNHNFFANGFLVSNCGREDIDARCLGWRPFVLEIENPKARSVRLREMQAAVNKGAKVKVRKLRWSGKKEVALLKAARPEKSYRATVVFEKPVGAKEMAKLRTLVGKPIKQRTPQRVLHRRADLERLRKVKAISWKRLSGKVYEVTVRGEAGLYIKELISGDNGRTRPSVAEILDMGTKVKRLDVIKIHVVWARKFI